ncbi:MAG: hypothetical protein JWL61_1891 [Gemmatimonadetes bacterium]|nr:hypothetical protein [Gemmatimonadota bacterium]
MGTSASRFGLNGFRDAVRRELSKGLSPDKLAFTIAIGFVIGVFPILGTTTALCVVVAVALRLNHPVIQAANYLASPIFVVLLVPFLRLGAWLSNDAALPLDYAALKAVFARGWFAAIAQLWSLLFHGVVAWLLVAPVLVGVLYFCLRPLTRRWAIKPASPRVSVQGKS